MLRTRPVASRAVPVVVRGDRVGLGGAPVALRAAAVGLRARSVAPGAAPVGFRIRSVTLRRRAVTLGISPVTLRIRPVGLRKCLVAAGFPAEEENLKKAIVGQPLPVATIRGGRRERLPYNDFWDGEATNQWRNIIEATFGG